MVADFEGVSVSREALAVIGEHASGSMRDALGLLDQLASYRNQEGDESRAIEPDDVRNLLGNCSERAGHCNSPPLWLTETRARVSQLINDAFEAGEDPRQLNRQLVAILRAVMYQVAASVPGIDDRA